MASFYLPLVILTFRESCIPARYTVLLLQRLWVVGRDGDGTLCRRSLKARYFPTVLVNAKASLRLHLERKRGIGDKNCERCAVRHTGQEGRSL